MIIAFQSQFLSLLDATGTPLGTDAVLMLSQLVWLAEHYACDSEGWFAWGSRDCEAQTGLTRYQQEAIRKRLCAAGYVACERRGESGVLHYRVCIDSVRGKLTNRTVDTSQFSSRKTDKLNGSDRGKLTNRTVQIAENSQSETIQIAENSQSELGFRDRIAENSQTEPVGSRKTDKLNDSDRGKLANRIAENSQTVSTKEILIYSPPVPPLGGDCPPPKISKTFVPPEQSEVLRYFLEQSGTAEDAAKFYDHFLAKGWRLSDGKRMSDWQAAVRNWIRRSAEFAAQRRPTGRASPPLASSLAEREQARLERWRKEGRQNG